MTASSRVDDEDGGLVILDREKQVVVAISAFFLSVIFISCGLLVLVRFWVFSNIFYNIFILTTLVLGIVFNIVSLDMLFSVETSITHVKILVYGTLTTIAWNITGIVLPLRNEKYFEMFSDVPFLRYDDGFYSGESFDSNVAVTEHPYVKKITPVGSSFFDHRFLVIGALVVVLLLQIAFWFYVLKVFIQIKRGQVSSAGSVKVL